MFSKSTAPGCSGTPALELIVLRFAVYSLGPHWSVEGRKRELSLLYLQNEAGLFMLLFEWRASELAAARVPAGHGSVLTFLS